MAKRFTDTDKWKKQFIKDLKAPYKLLWFYILDDCDIAGLWEVDIDVAQLRIGAEINYSDALAAFSENVVEVEPGRKWFIKTFIEFQYGPQLSKTNNIFKSVNKILERYNLYQYLTVEISDEGTTISAQRNRISQKVRDQVFLENEFTCQYCSEQKTKLELVVDHFVPLNKGGDNSDKNLVCACIRCNSHKTDLMPDDFLSRAHPFLNPTEKILKLNEAFNSLKAPYKDLLVPMDKDMDKDKDMELDKDKEKAREEKSTTPRPVFVPPSIPEVKEYISEKMGSLWTPAQVDALAFKFWEFYGKKGWKVGKTPMVNWHIACSSAIREWEIPGFTNNNKTNHNGKSNTQNDYDRFREAAREAGIADGITDHPGSQWRHPR